MSTKPLSSRDAILDAAAVEFADRGFDGVRMEHVARRAGVNKTLVYRHFGDKETLFRACLAREFAKRDALLAGLPNSLSELLVWWSRQQHKDAHFVRLILREAMEDDGAKPINHKERSAYYEKQVAQIRALQANGEIDDSLDPQMLFFALLTLTLAPVHLPQIARLAAPGPKKQFTVRWESFLQSLTRKLK